MKTAAFHTWLIRITALVVPLYSVFDPRIYEGENPGERRIRKSFLLAGFVIYTTAGIIYLLTK